MGSGPPLIQQYLILLTTPANYFQITSHSKVPSVRTLTYLFRGHNSTPLPTLSSIVGSICIFFISTASSVRKNISEKWPESFAGSGMEESPEWVMVTEDFRVPPEVYLSLLRASVEEAVGSQGGHRGYGRGRGTSRSSTGCPVSCEQLTNFQGPRGAPCQGNVSRGSEPSSESPQAPTRARHCCSSGVFTAPSHSVRRGRWRQTAAASQTDAEEVPGSTARSRERSEHPQKRRGL